MLLENNRLLGRVNPLETAAKKGGLSPVLPKLNLCAPLGFNAGRYGLIHIDVVHVALVLHSAIHRTGMVFDQ